MALTFRQMLFGEYPIPEHLSVFGGDGIETFPIADLDTLIATSALELRSDLYVTEYTMLGGFATKLPEDTIGVVSAKIVYGFQGNRSVKVQFDGATKMCYTRYFPSNLTYRRMLRVEDLPNLVGDFLVYAKSYVLYRMASLELSMLRSVVLETDAGSINLDALSSFRDSCLARYESMKDGIQIYVSGV